MKDEYNIFYNDEKIETRHSDALAESILSLGFREGDKLECYPFNHYQDERTEHVCKPATYHCIPLVISSFRCRLVESWNGNIRKIIDITLSDV